MQLQIQRAATAPFRNPSTGSRRFRHRRLAARPVRRRFAERLGARISAFHPYDARPMCLRTCSWSGWSGVSPIRRRRPKRRRSASFWRSRQKLSHFTLYALLLAVPFLGIIVQLKRGHALPIFGLWDFTSPWPADRGTARSILTRALLSRRRAFDPRRHSRLRRARCITGCLARPHLTRMLPGARVDSARSTAQPLSTFSAAAAPARSIDKIARYREEFHAALGKRRGAFGRMAIGAREFSSPFARLRSWCRDGHRLLSTADRRFLPSDSAIDRSDGPRKKPSMPGVPMMASKFCSAVRVSIMASVMT